MDRRMVLTVGVSAFASSARGRFQRVRLVIIRDRLVLDRSYPVRRAIHDRTTPRDVLTAARMNFGVDASGGLLTDLNGIRNGLADRYWFLFVAPSQVVERVRDQPVLRSASWLSRLNGEYFLRGGEDGFTQTALIDVRPEVPGHIASDERLSGRLAKLLRLHPYGPPCLVLAYLADGTYQP